MQLHLADSAYLEAPDGTRRPLAALDAALLAWLAIEGPTPRARLAALLWPLKDAAAARSSLRQRLFQLRRQTGTDVVEGDDLMALAAGVEHDLDDADGVLGTLSTDGVAAGEYALWLALQRERRRARTRSSLVELAEMAERARDWDDALDHARELLALEPLSEDAHRRVMRLHHLKGDRAAALLAFDACERMLKDEVGARPSPETMALLAALESAASAAPAGARGPGLPASVLRPPRLVGRAAAWSALEGAWAASRVAWLLGEAGVGKSRLLGDWMAVNGGSRSVTVGARPGDALLPNALLCRLLRAVLAAGPLALAKGIRAELACLLPELGPGTSTVDATRLALAVDTLFAEAVGSGLHAVAVDDLHWADPASVEALAQAFGTPGLRWLVAQRPAEGDSALQALRARVVDANRAETVPLPPLTVADVAELLDALEAPHLATSSGAAALHRRCGGNPLLLLECLKGDAAGGGLAPAPTTRGRSPPVGIGLIEGRLSRLTAPALRLARCAAVAGQDFHAALAAHVLKRDPLDLADAWRELESAHVLQDGAFAHDLVYEAALASVPTAIAGELHADIAAFLEAHGAEPARVAAHWLAAGRPGQALPHLRSAARQAKRQWRNAEAAAGFDEASRIAEAAGHFEDAARDHVAACDVRSRVATIGVADAQRARALARTERAHAWAALVEAAQAVETGDAATAAGHAERALALARRHGMTEAEAEALFDLAVACWDRGDVARALDHLDRSLVLWKGLNPDTCVLDAGERLQKITSAQGLVALRMGRFEEAQKRLQAAFEVALSDHAAAQGSIAAREGLQNALRLGRRDEIRHWDALVERAGHEHPGNSFEIALTAQARADWAAADGRWADALRHYDTMEAAMVAAEHRYAGRMQATRALFDFDLGRQDLALQRLRRLQVAGPPMTADTPVVEFALACVGQAADMHALLDRLATHPDLSLRLRLLPRLAPHCDPGAVLPTLALASQTARDGGALGLWAPLQAARARALRRAGRPDEAADSALAAWRAVDDGVIAAAPFPRFAADVAAALAPADPARAAAVAQRAASALQQSARALPPAWQGACVERSMMALEIAAVLRALGAPDVADRDAPAAPSLPT